MNESIDRTIVSFQSTEQGATYFCLHDPPHPTGKVVKLFPLQIDKNPFAELQEDIAHTSRQVREFGQLLYDELQKHEAVRARFQQVLEPYAPDPREQAPIYFYVGPLVGDDLPWEALHCGASSFLALTPRYPIGQIHESIVMANATEYTCLLPLKILLILSGPPAELSENPEHPAPQLDAASEWKNLWNAIDGQWVHDGALPLEVQVLTSDDRIVADINAKALAWLHVSRIVDRQGILDVIEDFGPRFIHVFCACSDGGDPVLEIQTRSDWEATMRGNRRVSIRLTAKDLRYADRAQWVWLVSLNCSDANESTRASRRLGRQLMQNGFPAALAMREPVNAEIARALFRQFYATALKTIAKIKTDGNVHQIEWASMLYEARKRIIESAHPQCDDDVAGLCRHWTIPVVYTREERFLVKRPAHDATVNLEEAANLRVLLGLREQFSRNLAMPDAERTLLVDSLNARIATLDKTLHSAGMP